MQRAGRPVVLWRIDNCQHALLMSCCGMSIYLFCVSLDLTRARSVAVLCIVFIYQSLRLIQQASNEQITRVMPVRPFRCFLVTHCKRMAHHDASITRLTINNASNERSRLNKTENVLNRYTASTLYKTIHKTENGKHTKQQNSYIFLLFLIAFIVLIQEKQYNESIKFNF